MCPPDCFCWDVESVLNETEAAKKNTATRTAILPCPRCGKGVEIVVRLTLDNFE
jgi:hypothetical protein